MTEAQEPLLADIIYQSDGLLRVYTLGPADDFTVTLLRVSIRVALHPPETLTATRYELWTRTTDATAIVTMAWMPHIAPLSPPALLLDFLG